jgi:hypothetical protein
VHWVDAQVVEVRNKEGGTDGGQLFTTWEVERMASIGHVRTLVVGGTGNIADVIALAGDGAYLRRLTTAEQLAVAVRGHWAVENRLHWVLDVSFGENASTVRKDNAPQNLSLLKKIVLNLIRLDTTAQKKTSLRLKRKAAAWDDDFRVRIMGFVSL